MRKQRPKLLDQIACASGYAGGYMATLSVVYTMFRWPIHVSALVTLVAEVNHTGSSSMELGIMVIAENIRMHET